MPEIIIMDPEHPEPDRIAHVAALVNRGGIVAYPTETFYGLGAHAGMDDAVERIFSIKGRSFQNPIALILGKRGLLDTLVVGLPAGAERLMDAFWPGPLTLLFHASPRIIPRLTAGTGKIGIRISSHPIASALAKAVGFPLTATSANLSGEAECTTAADVAVQLRSKVNAVIDGGKTQGGSPSTILDMTADPPVVLREGAIPATRIYAVLEKDREG